MDGYLYYPGCTLKTKASDYEESARTVMEALDVPLIEMDNWYCCGAVQSLAADDIMHQIAPIRTLICAQEQGESQVVTLCDMCYNVLKRANLWMREHPDDLETMNEFLDEDPDYRGEVEVYHLFEILRERTDDIATQVQHPLDDLTVAPYYGCMLLRPDEIAIDDTEDPSIMEDLLAAIGADVLDNPKRTECCGSYHVVNRPDIVERRVKELVLRMAEGGADVIGLSCPLCQYNLDSYQRSVGYDIPVLYLTELMALAFGLEAGLHKHRVDPVTILKERGVMER